jgi:hypothetical protein
MRALVDIAVLLQPRVDKDRMNPDGRRLRPNARQHLAAMIDAFYKGNPSASVSTAGDMIVGFESAINLERAKVLILEEEAAQAALVKEQAEAEEREEERQQVKLQGRGHGSQGSGSEGSHGRHGEGGQGEDVQN